MQLSVLSNRRPSVIISVHASSLNVFKCVKLRVGAFSGFDKHVYEVFYTVCQDLSAACGYKYEMER